MTFMGATMEARKFSYDDDTHTYRVGDMVIPGCTQILRGLGIIDTRWAAESDLIRGKAIHLGCKYLSEGCLDWESVDPSIKGWLEAYSHFLSEGYFHPKENELALHHPLYLYGVTFDTFGFYKDVLSVIEIKSYTLPKWVCLQTAAQTMAVAVREGIGWHKIKRYGLELHEDGTYRPPVLFDDPNDGPIFLAMGSAYTWKINAGIK